MFDIELMHVYYHLMENVDIRFHCNRKLIPHFWQIVLHKTLMTLNMHYHHASC